METAFSFILGLSAAIYIIKLLRFRWGLSRLKPGQSRETPRVAVVVAARNEEDEIGKCLEGLLNQDYPDDLYQVCVVDDGSTDRTPEIVKEAASRDNRLKLIRVDKPETGISPKKYAVTKGIENTDSEIVLLTDADCRVGPHWVRGMVSHFTPETGMVLGFTSYRPDPWINPWLFAIQSLDFLSHIICAAGAIGAGQAFNSNANNLAFRRRVYDEVGGYGRRGKFLSGDDDLLLQAVADRTSWKLDFATEPETYVVTRPSRTLKQVIKQRMRWASKGTAYNPGVLVFLLATFTFFAGLAVSLPFSIIFPLKAPLPLVLFGLKVGADYLVVGKGLRIFGKGEYLRYFPVTELVHIPLILVAAIGGQFLPHEWRGRVSGRKV